MPSLRFTGALYFAGGNTFALCLWLGAAGPAMAAAVPEWSGGGAYRVLVEIPTDQKRPSGDQSIAACELELAALLSQAEPRQRANIGTFQVHAYDPSTGKPKASHSSWGSTPFDIPCRYEDTAVADRYESRVGRASETVDGRAPPVSRLRKGRLFNREMNDVRGRLAWSHAEASQGSSHYAIYFDGVPEGAPPQAAPAPWLGDAGVLRAESGQPLGGWSHFTACVGDLNGDGLFDVIAGTEKGDLFWFINRGTAQSPQFLGCHLLKDEAGPIDVGWYAAPFVVDWDGDKDLDLLVGTSGNVLLWWRNVGSAAAHRFKYEGFVQADKRRLETPEQPVAEDPNGIFARDYFNQPWAGDFDGDGTPDLVTGGYTTGRVFYYHGAARDESGTPILSYQGELQADGRPIDTIWAAAPVCFDANGDQRIDLITGGWRWSGIPGPPRPGEEDLLQCYRRLEGPSEATSTFTKVKFPASGAFPVGSIARPSVVDANGDGLQDLFVSESGGNAYLFYNTGTLTEPRWDLNATPIAVPWGFTRDVDVAAPVVRRDDEQYIVGNVLYALRGSRFAPRKELVGVAKVAGKPIVHPGPGYGDPYYFSILCHFDEDDQADVLWGTQQGNIYWHRNSQAGEGLTFDEGQLIRLTNGEELRLGPPVVASAEDAKDFTVLQGSRIVFTLEDFDGDSLADILAGDTYGSLWLFRRASSQQPPVFEPGVTLAKLPTRPEAIACTDWDGDGRSDVLIGGSADDPIWVLKNESTPGRPAINPPTSVQGLPYLFWGPKVRAADWNGDGDVDLLVQSEFFSFWIERSFLEHGYRFAEVISGVESRTEHSDTNSRTK